MERQKKYMPGNYVRLKDTKEVHTVDYDNVNCLMLNTKDKVRGMFAKSEIEDIPLDDDFFVNNGYFYDCDSELFIADSGYGPAIRKRTTNYCFNDTVEYSIAGIIIRTVDEFQNLMNIIDCEKIADKVTL